jgi:hypothetical protein
MYQHPDIQFMLAQDVHRNDLDRAAQRRCVLEANPHRRGAWSFRGRR